MSSFQTPGFHIFHNSNEFMTCESLRIFPGLLLGHPVEGFVYYRKSLAQKQERNSDTKYGLNWWYKTGKIARLTKRSNCVFFSVKNS